MDSRGISTSADEYVMRMTSSQWAFYYLLMRHCSVRVNVLCSDIIYSLLLKTRRAKRHTLDDGLKYISIDRPWRFTFRPAQRYVYKIHYTAQSLKVESKSFRYSSRRPISNSSSPQMFARFTIDVIVGVVMTALAFPTYRLFPLCANNAWKIFIALWCLRRYLLTPSHAGGTRREKKTHPQH